MGNSSRAREGRSLLTQNFHKELAPDYMYIVNGERKHKFGYRLKRFQSDPELKYVVGLTERELAALNGLERVWDAGKTRYRKTF